MRRIAVTAGLALAWAGALAAPSPAAPTWLQADPLSTALDFQAPSPMWSDVATDAGGTAIAVWLGEDDSHTMRTEAALHLPNGDWQALGFLSADGAHATDASVAFDASGVAYAVWERGGVIQLARRPRGGTFQLVGDVSGAAALSPRMAVQPDGTLWLAWLEAGVVKYTSRSAQGSFSPTLTAGGGDVWQGHLTVAAGPAGDVAIGWERDGFRRVEARYKPKDGTFGEVEPLAPVAAAGDEYADLRLIVDGTGAATAIWRRIDGPSPWTYTFQQTSRTRQLGFDFGVDLFEPTDFAEWPMLAVAPDGAVTAVWTRTLFGAFVVQAATKPRGGSFGPEQEVSASTGQTESPDVAITADGRAVVVWSRSVSGQRVIQAAERAAGASQFGEVHTLSRTGVNSNLAHVAADGEGNAVAVWKERNLGGGPGAYTGVRTMAAGYDAAPPALTTVSVPGTATIGALTAASATATDRWSPVTLSWNFGDGTTATGGAVAHAFRAAGVFDVTVTAADAVGNTTSRTRRLQALPAAAPDADGDGFNAAQDCDDANATVRPGGREVPGDGVDQDCDDRDAPFPSIRSTVSTTWAVGGRRFRLDRLKVKQPPGRARRTALLGPEVPVRQGPVPYGQVGAIDLRAKLRGKKRMFWAGQVVPGARDAPAFHGKLVTYRLKAGKVPKGRDALLAPRRRQAAQELLSAIASLRPMDGNGTPVRIRHFTDPGCPFAFSAERQRLRIDWLYGDQLAWSTHLVVLAETRPTEFPPERIAQGRRTLHERYGMPMAWTPAPPVAATLEASRAVVAARLRTEDGCGPLLRRLRVLCFSGLALDDADVIARAAAEAGLDPAALAGWMAEPEVEQALRDDMRAARSPSPASRAQDYKLGGPADERRYTCPSYEIERVAPAREDWHTADRVDLPGFRPVEAYETALANIAPELARRPDPEDVGDVLTWAGMPLATAEIAAVCDRPITDVREALARIARFEPVGGDGYWAPA